ncbi:hypothetical protein MTR67_012551 [Solanum verrucosum]|uniref:Uncharacterized protein n=1 Tax=Solanum verrucosum TaxID=315347 RepID=A0AAF0QEP6_SOLVR|nr:hypothetical protein MTR67_012551 [Solanum verrucosum]
MASIKNVLSCSSSWSSTNYAAAATYGHQVNTKPCHPVICWESVLNLATLSSTTCSRAAANESKGVNLNNCCKCIAGTGDHTFERRLRLGGPLLKENIATMVLESPFYGKRRPLLQRGSKLLCVSDLLLLGRATIEEARSLLHWLDCEAGFGKMGICGLSMGGVHAAMVGSLHPTPIATLPFLSPHSAVVAFCEGVLKHATAWEALRDDLSVHEASMTLEEVKERMRNVLSLTDVTRFPIPKDPSAVIFVAATDDGYIPRHSVLELEKAWPGSEVRWVRGGHVSSFLLHNGAFRRAIVDGLNRLQWKESPL